MSRLIILTCLATFIAYHASKYDLFGPNINYDDGTYYYVLGSASVADGSNELRIAHPGLNLMLFGSWFFSLADFFSFINASSLSDIALSNDPIKMLLDLTILGKIFAFFICLAYLALIFLLVNRLTGNKVIALLALLYNFFYIGILEQMFILRPEPLSAVFMLLALYLLLRFMKAESISNLVWVSASFGFLLSSTLLAKLNTLIFVPVLLYFYYKFVSPKKIEHFKTSVCLFSVILGCVISFLLFALNGAKNPFSWAEEFLMFGIGQTFYLTFISKTFTGGNTLFPLQNILNHDIVQIASNQLFFLALVIIGYYYAAKKQRLNIIFGVSFIILLSIFNAMRGGESFAFYYRIYFLAVESLVAAISIQSIFNNCNMRSLQTVILLVFAIFLSHDYLKISKYRNALFSVKENSLHAFRVLDYWERGRFANDVLKPKYCVPKQDKEACINTLAYLLDEGQKRH